MDGWLVFVVGAAVASTVRCSGSTLAAADRQLLIMTRLLCRRRRPLPPAGAMPPPPPGRRCRPLCRRHSPRSPVARSMAAAAGRVVPAAHLASSRQWARRRRRSRSSSSSDLQHRVLLQRKPMPTPRSLTLQRPSTAAATVGLRVPSMRNTSE